MEFDEKCERSKGLRKMNDPANNGLKNLNGLRQIDYWINSANHDLDVSETLFKSGKYDWWMKN